MGAVSRNRNRTFVDRIRPGIIEKNVFGIDQSVTEHSGILGIDRFRKLLSARTHEYFPQFLAGEPRSLHTECGDSQGRNDAAHEQQARARACLGRLSRGMSGGRLAAIQGQSVGMDRPRDVLDVLVADILGVMGGWLIGTTKLGFNSAGYLKATMDFLQVMDVASGLVKAAVFGFIITLMGCWCGYNSRGGAQGVGAATTTAVVASSILILAFDYILTEMFFAR